jgi:L-ascorbate metabolism protein UlaG (beta-lactamase superfamily)
MRVRRLGWAGLEIEAQGATVVVDLVEEAEPLRSALPPGALVSPAGKASAALVTHLHSDHADPAAIERVLAPGGVVLRPAPFDGSRAENWWTAPAEAGFARSDLTVNVVREWQTTMVGPFEITAVPAVDGLGDPQVSWVVTADGQRVFHGGDTIFHGYWWLIAGRFGPFDAAFLPINGAVVDFGHLRPASPLPADLTPEQAAVAGLILQARQVVPIHFGIVDQPVYVEVDDPAVAFRAAAEKHGVQVTMLAPGEEIDLSQVGALT